MTAVVEQGFVISFLFRRGRVGDGAIRRVGGCASYTVSRLFYFHFLLLRGGVRPTASMWLFVEGLEKGRGVLDTCLESPDKHCPDEV